MKIGPEAIEQLKTTNWVNQNYPDLFYVHIANERKCSKIYGDFLRRMGVKKGALDLFFPQGNGISSGLWIEMKIKPNKLTPDQIKFMNIMRKLNYLFVSYGFGFAISFG